MFEDDNETEDQQPPDLRDRPLPGRNGGARRFRPRAHSAAAPPRRRKHELPQAAEPAYKLLQEILEKMGLAQIEVDYIPRPEGEYFEINGPDLAMLIGKHGNTLESLNLVFNNILNLGVRENRKYYTIDAEGYRARRADHLKNQALLALERCIREKKPQPLEPMLPSERKIVHLALAENTFVRTESEGEEPERRVVVFPK